MDRFVFLFFFFQAEDGIRDLVQSRGLGDVYKGQDRATYQNAYDIFCPLYTLDAADDLLCVDLGGRRIIKKKIVIVFGLLLVLFPPVSYPHLSLPSDVTD